MPSSIDRIGTLDYDLNLSQERAQCIKGPESGSNKALVQCLAPDRHVVIEDIGSRR